MNKLKVVKVDSDLDFGSDYLEFNNGVILTSDHDRDCCESHYLSLGDLTLDDFDGLEFDLSSDMFFERIENYGIALIPLFGHPVSIPGYGSNNGYYDDQLDLVLVDNGRVIWKFDITDCQVVTK